MARRIIICDGAENARLWSRIGAGDDEALMWVAREKEARARPPGFRILHGKSPAYLVFFCICTCIDNAVWTPTPPHSLLLRLCLSLLRSRIHGTDSSMLPNNIQALPHFCILCI